MILSKIKSIIIKKPDDWHVHLRDGNLLKYVLPYTSKNFMRAIIMPNLFQPIFTSKDAFIYKKQILSILQKNHNFTPLMTIYLTEDTNPDDLEKGYNSGIIQAVKLYPSGVTTNSKYGIKNFSKVYNVFERMIKIGMCLLVHCEIFDKNIDIFDREIVFINKILEPIIEKFPELKVVIEHITTKDAIEFVLSKNKNLAASITPHHLMMNRNIMFINGFQPHYYCLPVLKHEKHRQALRSIAVSGNKKFFLGTDSAPHFNSKKISTHGCAGIFNSPNAIICCAAVFEEENALNKLENFLSINGPMYYGLPINQDKITLYKVDKSLNFIKEYAELKNILTIFNPLVPLYWRVK